MYNATKGIYKSINKADMHTHTHTLTHTPTALIQKKKTKSKRYKVHLISDHTKNTK